MACSYYKMIKSRSTQSNSYEYDAEISLNLNK